MIQKIKKARVGDVGSDPEHPYPPIVVHCSAGIGRTGTLITIYSILESVEAMCQLEEVPAPTEDIIKKFPNWKRPRISVFGAVRKMREQRWNMVKKNVQYSFVYLYMERWVRKNQFDLMIN